MQLWMALGYLACDTVNQIGGAEHSAATQGNLLCKVEMVLLVVVSPLVRDEEWNSQYQCSFETKVLVFCTSMALFRNAHLFLNSYSYCVFPSIFVVLFLQFGQWHKCIACSPSQTCIKVPEASCVFCTMQLPVIQILKLECGLTSPSFCPRHCRISLVL